MARLEIIGKSVSPFVWTVRLACEEKGVDHELKDEAPHQGDIAAIHPLGKMPVMRHGDFTLCESKAITTYIDQTFDGPRLIPRDVRAAARVEQWVSIVNSSLSPVMVGDYAMGYFFADENGVDQRRIERAAQTMTRHFDVLENAIGAENFIAGKSYSLADVYLTPVLFYATRFPEGGALLDAHPRVKDYLRSLVMRASFKATLPQPPTG
jgi:glutathione S-transferase